MSTDARDAPAASILADSPDFCMCSAVLLMLKVTRIRPPVRNGTNMHVQISRVNRFLHFFLESVHMLRFLLIYCDTLQDATRAAHRAQRKQDSHMYKGRYCPTDTRNLNTES